MTELIDKQEAMKCFESWLKEEFLTSESRSILKAVLFKLRNMPVAKVDLTEVSCVIFFNTAWKMRAENVLADWELDLIEDRLKKYREKMKGKRR